MESKIILSEDKSVLRVDKTVQRPAQPWSQNTLDFTKHLRGSGLEVENIYEISNGLEISEFVEGEMVHPQKWSDEALFEIGKFIALLHKAGATFKYNEKLGYKGWCLREIGRKNDRIWCHGDIAPWNVITMNGMPHKLIDWEFSGMLDPLVELARVCWLFPQLVDDDLQKIYDLPSPQKRAEQVRLICDGYGLTEEERAGMVKQIIEVIICETAHEAIDPKLTFSGNGSLWGFAWRTRSLYWVWRNKEVIEKALW